MIGIVESHSVDGKSHQASSLKRQKKMQRKKSYIYSTITLKIQRCSEDKELNQARSKPDLVDLPVRTARTVRVQKTRFLKSPTVFFGGFSRFFFKFQFAVLDAIYII